MSCSLEMSHSRELKNKRLMHKRTVMHNESIKMSTFKRSLLLISKSNVNLKTNLILERDYIICHEVFTSTNQIRGHKHFNKFQIIGIIQAQNAGITL